MSDSKQSLGGIARRDALPPEIRKSIAEKAAAARWGKPGSLAEMPEADSQGVLPIGDVTVEVYVLKDRRRLIHKRGMARALGLKSEGGNAFMKTISRRGLGSVISPDLWETIANPIEFQPLNGDPAHGYRAETFIDVCNAIIDANKLGLLARSQLFFSGTSGDYSKVGSKDRDSWPY